MRRVHRGAFAAATLSGNLNRAGLSGRDRSLVTDLIYGVLRFELMLDACLAPRLKRPDKLPEAVRDMLRLGSYEILLRGTPRPVAVNEWVDIANARERRLSGLVNAVLRRVDIPDALPEAIRYGLPGWLYEEWQALFGPTRARDVATAMNEPESLWLKSYHPQASHSLIEEGCEVRLGPVDGALAVRPSKPLGELEAYRRGWVQPQNPASTLPVQLLEPQPGERILDLASGSGVKAVQIAAAGARPLSVELHEKKLERARRNLKRLGLEAETLQHDLRTVPDLPPAGKVLLDAPCSGTGTLRGNPEIRSRVTLDTVQELAALQRDLLETAATLTRPGGLLVYAVCALTEAEGTGMTRWFLDNHPDFHAEPYILDLPAANSSEGSYILPLEGLDGFYIVRLRRAKA